MPKFTFKCAECDTTTQLLAELTDKPVCPLCEKLLVRQLPSLTGPTDVFETIDSNTNIKHRPDQKALIKERNSIYYWKHVVPQLAADPKYSLETKLDNGWITVDENGHIHVQDKPPEKR